MKINGGALVAIALLCQDTHSSQSTTGEESTSRVPRERVWHRGWRSIPAPISSESKFDHKMIFPPVKIEVKLSTLLEWGTRCGIDVDHEQRTYNEIREKSDNWQRCEDAQISSMIKDMEMRLTQQIIQQVCDQARESGKKVDCTDDIENVTVSSLEERYPRFVEEMAEHLGREYPDDVSTGRTFRFLRRRMGDLIFLRQDLENTWITGRKTSACASKRSRAICNQQ